MHNKGLTADASSVFQIKIDSTGQSFPCFAGQTVLQALTDGGVFMEANCGGRGTCGKCRLQVLQGKVADPQGLSAVARQEGVYLACQIYPSENLTVAFQEKEASAKGSVSVNFEDDGNPLLKKVVVTPEYPTVENHYSLQEMIGHALKMSGFPAHIPDSPHLIRQLAAAASPGSGPITIVLACGEIIALEPGDSSGSLYGVAFDIGTTTVVGMLVDVRYRSVIATHSRTNPQAAFGADVISRIDAASRADGLEAQAGAVRQCLNQIVRSLCISADISARHIYAAAIAGNSTMEHLLLKVAPVSLTLKPYAAAFRHMAPFPPAEIDLEINPGGKILLLPNIASFIGADTTAAVLATDQDILNSHTLMVDLGTNGEMVLGNRHKLFACSAAAGPAFEGAHIKSGMRASAGAIEDVTISDDVYIRVIGPGKAAGICGSGLVKAASCLLKKGILSASGRFDQNLARTLSPRLAERLRRQDNQWEFVLVPGKDSANGVDIVLTQADVRQLQLVKSAICTGVEFLLEKVCPSKDMPVYLAGAFGNYIDIESALGIGLLPGLRPEQVRPVGNAAGIGAVRALLSREQLARCGHISEKIEYVELAAQPQFQSRFLANLSFPEVSL
ncbi:ASKHA domain-containing protein [Acetonema longum]|uniref:Ferredoxin n=1 Tax=Acetonema longum DSM 6540 TaxID=1009370 RepID=F7NLQ4_9FIRM|nr:ASKHA domain-containing protein [Acetonema longum]EGO62995.1 ferredoxin [Acetonema longum DSM 6540]